MSARPEEPAWQRTLRLLFLSAFAVLAVASCCTGRLPQTPLANYGQDCGSVIIAPNSSIIGDPQPPEDCLFSAYTRCRAATLRYNGPYSDYGGYHQLRVVPAVRGCLLEDRVTPGRPFAGWLNANIYIPPVYECESLQWVTDGLITDGPNTDGLITDGLMAKGCDGERDFVIPLYPANIGQMCGHVSNLKNEVRSDSPEALRCFWLAYTHCQAATLILVTDTIPWPQNFPPPQNYISFQRSNGACAISLVEWRVADTVVPHTCAELINRRNQLVVSACGALGDVVIPLAPGSPLP